MMMHLVCPFRATPSTAARSGFDADGPSTGAPSSFARGGLPYPVYVVESDRRLRIELNRQLSGAGFEPRPFAEFEDFAAALPDLSPGCVILDLAAHAEDYAALRADASRGGASLPVILLFSSLSQDDAVAAVRLGAADLLQRPVSMDALVAALRRAEPGVLDAGWQIAACRARAAVEALTPREREVMDCMMTGRTTKETSRLIGISPRTVEMHRARLHKRLGTASLAELLAIGWQARSAGA